MDVLVGPTFAIDVQSSPPFTGDLPTGKMLFAGDSSESESSIGTPDDSDDQNDTVSPKRNRAEDEDEEEEEEVQSKFKGLHSLDSLEDSLPIKKGLSNHFIGKSKSFTDLSQVSTVKELQKQENPFNKRRRVLIASKWSRKSSFYTWSNPKSMPLLPVDEDEDDNENETYKEASSSSSSIEEKKNPQEQQQQQQVMMMRQQNKVPQSYAEHMRLRLGSFKSRSFSLADLQEHDEDEDEDEDN